MFIYSCEAAETISKNRETIKEVSFVRRSLPSLGFFLQKFYVQLKILAGDLVTAILFYSSTVMDLKVCSKSKRN